MKFCVYLTVYSGSALPPFYIGSTSIAKIKKGYRGSVVSQRYKSIWKNEIKNNPHLFKVKVIAEYDDRTKAFECEERLQRSVQAISNPLYINQSYGHKDTAGGWNKGVPAWNRGMAWSQKTKDKISASKKNPSEETRKRMSAASKGKKKAPLSQEHREKISRGRTGIKHTKPAWNKGKTGVYSEAIIENLRQLRLGKPNPIVAESNRRRKGTTHKKPVTFKGKPVMTPEQRRERVNFLKRERRKRRKELGLPYT